MNYPFYLAQARQAFEKAIDLDPSCRAYQIELADILNRLGEYGPAWTVLSSVLSELPKDPGCYLLALEIAFRDRRFDRMTALAESAVHRLPEGDPARAVMEWWLTGEESNAKA